MIWFPIIYSHFFNECVKTADFPKELIFADITQVNKRRDKKRKLQAYLSELKYMKAVFIIRSTKHWQYTKRLLQKGLQL